MCQKCEKQKNRQKIFDGINSFDNPYKVKKDASKLRLDVCRLCSYFIATEWKCRMNGENMRKYTLNLNNHCPMPVSKW